MTYRSIALDDGWHVREALGDTWRWYVDADRELGVPTRVPGSVVVDLWRAGELADPYRGRNTRAAEWTGARHWVYRRPVEVPPLTQGERAVLEFDGIDPSATILWDGVPIARATGLYHRTRVEIPEPAPGTHRLAVVVDPVPASQPQVGRTELVRVHRPRMNEGWDFCPRFPHQGIWRPVRLLVGSASVTEVRVRTSADGGVTLSATIEGDYRVSVGRAGETVAEERGRADGPVTVELRVPEPEPWWPRGLGPATLYGVTLEIDGAPAWTGDVGFRTAELADGYTAVVNGVPVPLVGWNWVPVDAQYGAVAAERVRHLVGLAARSGARILRVWGGGLVETDEFYAACDAAGLLVWQEFSQSSSGISSTPAADDEFVRMMVAEAEAVVPPRVHHPSLLLWCGGNELADDEPLDEERSPVLAALRDAVARLDPGRPWLPTSPSGGPDDDVHGPWEHQGVCAQPEHYDARTSRAHTEFGVEGMANRRLLHHLVADAERRPAERDDPVYRHLGEWWNNAPLVRASFGDRLDDLESLRRASQLLQASGLQYAVEANRRRWPRCAMVLPWQLHESYPNAWCTSAVDFRGEPKPAYHAVARAFARRRVTVRVRGPRPAARLSAEAWVWDEDGTAPGSRVVARLRDAEGTVLAEASWCVAEALADPRPVGTLTATDVPPDSVVVWDVTWTDATGAELDRELMLATTGADFAPLLDLPPATIDARCDGAAVHVAHRGGPLVVGLQLVDDGPVDAPCELVSDGDPRPLLPGETRTFAIHRAAPAVLESWNTEPVRVLGEDR